MASDISREFRDRRDHYHAVVGQQGRVIVDRDFNLQQDIASERLEAEARDVVGPCGTPDDGFAISLPELSPPEPPLWSPPAPLPPPQRERPLDFLIKPGTMYVGGQRVSFPVRQAGQQITYSYYDQPDWVRPDPAQITVERADSEAVFLHLIELEVGATEDPDMLDVALGGVDTTARLRLLRRVRRQLVSATDCATAWAKVTQQLRGDGLLFDAATMRLLPQVRLQASFTQSETAANACDPVATGGFLGPDNQVIRVQIADAGSGTRSAQLLWGWDNASFLYRVAATAGNGSMLRLTRDPPDAYHVPQTGQVVEVLRTAAVIASEPDETDPSRRATIVRCIAEPTGFVTTLTQPYGPATSGGGINYLVLKDPLPAAFLKDETPLFVRIWQAELPFAATGGTVELTDPSTKSTTGVKVAISVPRGFSLSVGAYWTLAVRPSTPQAIYPERLLTSPQPPDGPREWACPLAVIDWRTIHGTVIEDCRNSFDNLVALTRRKPGCCTLGVTPDELNRATFQSIVDRAAKLADTVAVCLGPGTYVLEEPLRLTSLHDNMIFEACPGGVVIEAKAHAPLTAFTDGLITLDGATGVTLRGITFVLPTASPPAALARSLSQLSEQEGTTPAEIDSMLSGLAVMIGVHACNCSSLTIESCHFEFVQTVSPPASYVFGAALLLQGDCIGLAVRDSAFLSRLPTTLTAIQQASSEAPASSSDEMKRAYVMLKPGQLNFLPLAIAGASPPTSAPTLDMITADIASRTRTAVDALVADDLMAKSLGFIRQSVISTAGCVAMPIMTGGSTLLCSLGDASLCGNRFTGLTVAVAAWFGAETLRLEGNNAAKCVAGLWLELTGHEASSNSAYALITTANMAFREALLLRTIAPSYPPPTEPGRAVPRILIDERKPIAAFYTPASLLILNNDIEALPSGGYGSSALMVLANRAIENDSEDTTTSLVIAGNRLRSRTAASRELIARDILGYVPAAFLVTPDLARCAVTGNVIFNEPPLKAGWSRTQARSLYIMPRSVAFAELLAVTGNVLFGPSNLEGLTIPNSSPAQSWLPHNSTFPP